MSFKIMAGYDVINNVPKELEDEGYSKLVGSLHQWDKILSRYSESTLTKACAGVMEAVERYFDDVIGLFTQRKKTLLQEVAIAFENQKAQARAEEHNLSTFVSTIQAGLKLSASAIDGHIPLAIAAIQGLNEKTYEIKPLPQITADLPPSLKELATNFGKVTMVTSTLVVDADTPFNARLSRTTSPPHSTPAVRATTPPSHSTVEKKEQVRRKERDPNAPKRCLSAFMLFAQKRRPACLKANPNASFPEIGQLLGVEWKNLDSSGKEEFEQMAMEDKKRYEREREIYLSNRLSAEPADDFEPESDQ